MQRGVQALAILLMLFTTTSAYAEYDSSGGSLVLDKMTERDQDITRRAYRCAHKEKIGSRRGFICAVLFVSKIEKYEKLKLKTVLQTESNSSAKTIARSIVQMHVDQMLAEVMRTRQKKMSKCVQNSMIRKTAAINCMGSLNYGQEKFRLVRRHLYSLDLFTEEDIQRYKKASVPEM